MSNLDGVINKAKDFVNLAGKKTGEVLETSKLKVEKMNKSAQLQKNYEALGRSCYLDYKGLEAQKDSDKIKQIINSIDILEAEIKNIENSISEMKNNNICAYCGKKNNKKFLYCTNCGSPLYPNNVKTTNDEIAVTSDDIKNSENIDENLNNESSCNENFSNEIANNEATHNETYNSNTDENNNINNF